MYSRKRLFIIGLAITLVFGCITSAIANLAGICIVRALAGLGKAIATPASVG
jgi:MFS family permease